MSEGVGQLGISTAPFLSSGLRTRRLMWEVNLALLPVVVAATWYFGVTALLVTASAVAGTVLTEWSFTRGASGADRLLDGSALLTGLLLAMTLPPSIPLWMAFLGGVVAVALGKTIWGGLGHNLFNPALVGRAFLQAAFPVTLTTWTAPRAGLLRIEPVTIAFPMTHVDVTTSATPLGLAKFEGQATDLVALLTGHIGGCLGETSAALLIAVGVVLALRRVFDWRLPLSTLLTVAVLSGGLRLIRPDLSPGAGFMLLSGGLMFAAVFMVTDPVTTPLTARGAWIFGFGVGLLVVLIRLFGGLPEGVMYAILLMNSVTPLINRFTQPRRFGG